MDDESEYSIMITSSIEAEQEIMAVTITIQTIKTPVSRKLKKKKGNKNDASQARCKICLKTFGVHDKGKSA
ncbi:unnamed protein product, partial [Rotaria magnacalcarata]